MMTAAMRSSAARAVMGGDSTVMSRHRLAPSVALGADTAVQTRRFFISSTATLCLF